MAGSGVEEGGVMMESEGVRGRECRETTSEGKWPINLERNVDQKFTGKDNTREKEERRRDGKENRMIFLLTPPKCSHRDRDSGGNRSDGGKKKKRKKKKERCDIGS